MELIFPSEQLGSSNTDLYDAIQVVSRKNLEAKKIKNKKYLGRGSPLMEQTGARGHGAGRISIIALAMIKDTETKKQKRKRKSEKHDCIPGARGHGAGRMRRVILPSPWSQVWYKICDM
jgi:hypothetical protein